MENSYNFNGPKIDLPNATLVLVLGIVSIVGCCCWGILGIICGIIAIVMAKSATDLYVADPGKFTESSYNNVNTGKTCAWIGLILSASHLIVSLIIMFIYGFAAFTNPESILEQIRI